MTETSFPTSYHIAEVEISYRNPIPFQDRIRVVESDTAYKVLKQVWDENKLDLIEQAKILLLDRSNNCLGVCDLSTGGIHGCIIDPRVVFVTALKAHASGVILAHNHPSGNVKPSEPDIALTHRLVKAGKLLDIMVLDHLILTSESYYSFAEEGRMPRPG